MEKESLKQKIPGNYHYLLNDDDIAWEISFYLQTNPKEEELNLYLENWDYYINFLK